MKKLTSIFALIALLLSLFPVAVSAATSINSIEMGILHPSHMETPDTLLQIYGSTCQIDTSVNTDGYKNGIRWKNNNSGRFMTAGETFIGGFSYELSVCLAAKTGYVFAASHTTATVNMDPAALTVQDLTHARASITMEASYLFINYVTVEDLNTPKEGELPDYTASVAENTCRIMDDSSTYGYINGISWLDTANQSVKHPSGTAFEAGHTYQVDFFIEAFPGYEFPQNVQVTVSGKSVVPYQNNGKMLTIVLSYTIEENHVHTVSDWRITQPYHYNVCTVCGDMLEQEDHIWSPQMHSAGAEGHSYQCAVCKAFDSLSMTPHTPGPAGTPDAAVVCKDCGYIITPAKNHKHNLTKIPATPATCTEAGNIEYYTCDGCSEIFSDSEGKNVIYETELVNTSPLGHKTSEGWSNDGEFHWRTCSACGTVLDETKMAHEMKDEKCTTCGYATDAAVTTPADSDTATDTATADTDEGGIPSWVWLCIGIGGGLALGVIIGIAVMLILKKNKTKGETKQ